MFDNFKRYLIEQDTTRVKVSPIFHSPCVTARRVENSRKLNEKKNIHETHKTAPTRSAAEITLAPRVSLVLSEVSKSRRKKIICTALSSRCCWLGARIDIYLSKDVVQVQRWLSEHLFFYSVFIFGFYVILLQRDSWNAIRLAIAQAQGKHYCSQRNTRKYTSCCTTICGASTMCTPKSFSFRLQLAFDIVWEPARESESELRCDLRATEK